MVVAFCDLKGSTKALRCLGPQSFANLQHRFFSEASKAVRSVNIHSDHVAAEVGLGIDETMFPAPWARVDKFMGDCAMFYLRCANAHVESKRTNFQPDVELFARGARSVLVIIDRIIRSIDKLNCSPEFSKLRDAGIFLGSRIGLAAGASVALGPLRAEGEGTEDVLPGESYTVTGETVNLAARLEHATAAEFLSCVADVRSDLDLFAKGIVDRKHLHGTDLGNEFNQSDRQVVDIYDVCRCRFQVRANEYFVNLLKKAENPIKLRWRDIPFSPQGFEGRQVAYLLGGNSSSDLFRPV
jgi:class 3 adenylate cyclase